ncbi:hypothetical protein NEOKW01_1340 [Nematocida sp. AWRm80]|nr:hypothetical protein NEOKW01_1340 [Nematocida sp. AWRm80]
MKISKTVVRFTIMVLFCSQSKETGLDSANGTENILAGNGVNTERDIETANSRLEAYEIQGNAEYIFRNLNEIEASIKNNQELEYPAQLYKKVIKAVQQSISSNIQSLVIDFINLFKEIQYQYLSTQMLTLPFDKQCETLSRWHAKKSPCENTYVYVGVKKAYIELLNRIVYSYTNKKLATMCVNTSESAKIAQKLVDTWAIDMQDVSLAKCIIRMIGISAQLDAWHVCVETAQKKESFISIPSKKPISESLKCLPFLSIFMKAIADEIHDCLELNIFHRSTLLVNVMYFCKNYLFNASKTIRYNSLYYNMLEHYGAVQKSDIKFVLHVLIEESLRNALTAIEKTTCIHIDWNKRKQKTRSNIEGIVNDPVYSILYIYRSVIGLSLSYLVGLAHYNSHISAGNIKEVVSAYIKEFSTCMQRAQEQLANYNHILYRMHQISIFLPDFANINAYYIEQNKENSNFHDNIAEENNMPLDIEIGGYLDVFKPFYFAVYSVLIKHKLDYYKSREMISVYNEKYRFFKVLIYIIEKTKRNHDLLVGHSLMADHAAMLLSIIEDIYKNGLHMICMHIAVTSAQDYSKNMQLIYRWKEIMGLFKPKTYDSMMYSMLYSPNNSYIKYPTYDIRKDSLCTQNSSNITWMVNKSMESSLFGVFQIVEYIINSESALEHQLTTITDQNTRKLLIKQINMFLFEVANIQHIYTQFQRSVGKQVKQAILLKIKRILDSLDFDLCANSSSLQLQYSTEQQLVYDRLQKSLRSLKAKLFAAIDHDLRDISWLYKLTTLLSHLSFTCSSAR